MDELQRIVREVESYCYKWGFKIDYTIRKTPDLLILSIKYMGVTLDKTYSYTECVLYPHIVYDDIIRQTRKHMKRINKLCTI